MSRLSPVLLYLAIYNPTLRPSAPVFDDEDAEEQAQILFYTAREHAVSRDKMLRQVGLAKALINFSDMISGGDVCENVHSQSRRMVMVSPEPGFWIHACIALGKTRWQAAQNKAKARDKAKDKGKATAKEVPEHVYDYHDGSVSNTALRSHLLGGYERFKVTHGSFTSILHAFGQQALELQLERFFTPWAWNWDIEQDREFSSYLGLPLHPQHKYLTSLLDEFSQDALPNVATPFLLSPPHIIPSSSYTSTRIPWVIPQYLCSRIPPPRPPSISVLPPSEPHLSASAETLKAGTDGMAEGAKDALNATGSAFLAIGASMDVRKWSWPGYLTFGKNTGRQMNSRTPEQPKDNSHPDHKDEVTVNDNPEQLSEIKVDKESLQDAMSSFGIGTAEESLESNEDPADVSLTGTEATSVPNPRAPSNNPDVKQAKDVSLSSSDLVASSTSYQSGSTERSTSPESLPPGDLSSQPSSPLQDALPVASIPVLSFMRLPVYLSPPDEPQLSSPKSLLYIIRNELVFAFLADPDSGSSEEELSALCERASSLLSVIQNRLDEYASARPETPMVSATKILQPKDKFVIVADTGAFMISQEFSSRSEHLFNAQDLIGNPDIQEVFSRTQGPQHWHIARREQTGEVYMEVARKETSLSDVDNEVAGLLRQFRDSFV